MLVTFQLKYHISAHLSYLCIYTSHDHISNSTAHLPFSTSFPPRVIHLWIGSLGNLNFKKSKPILAANILLSSFNISFHSGLRFSFFKYTCCSLCPYTIRPQMEHSHQKQIFIIAENNLEEVCTKFCIYCHQQVKMVAFGPNNMWWKGQQLGMRDLESRSRCITHAKDVFG